MTKRYQQIAITLYVSVCFAILFTLFLNLTDFINISVDSNGPPKAQAPLLPVWSMVGANLTIVTALICLERMLTHKSLPDLPRREAVAHLVIRFLLVFGMIVLGRAPFAVYMVYPVLLFSFFAFDRRFAYGFTLFSTIFVAGYLITFTLGPSFIMPDLYNLFVYLLGLLMVVLMANVLLQERETNRQLQLANSHLGESHAKLQAYSAQVAALAATDERNRLARDIHDSLGHHLTASSIQLEKAALFLDRDLNKSQHAIEHAQRTVREALTEVRTSVRALREEENGFDLIPALNDLVSRMSHHDLSIDFRATGDSTPYSTFVKMTIYRIIQEGLTNIHKHARADQAQIDLTFGPQQADLTICDDGQGFEVEKLLQRKQSSNGIYGLQGIQERVALVGGRYEIQSELHKGTSLSITAPIRNSMIDLSP